MHSTTVSPLSTEHTARATVCQEDLLWGTLTPRQKAVILVIDTVSGIDALAQAVGVKRRHARRLVRQLETIGALHITAHARGGRGCRAEFVLHYTPPPLKKEVMPSLPSNQSDDPLSIKEAINEVIPASEPPQNEVMDAENEVIPDGVTREAYEAAIARLAVIGATWEQVRVVPFAGSFILVLPNSDGVMADGSLRIRTLTPAQRQRQEREAKLAEIQARNRAEMEERNAVMEAQRKEAAKAQLADFDAEMERRRLLRLGNQHAHTCAREVDLSPMTGSLGERESDQTKTRQDDPPLDQSISSPLDDDRSPRARTRGFVVSDALLDAVEREAKVFGRRAEIRALLEEVGPDFRNVKWSIPILVRTCRAKHLEKYPGSNFRFGTLASWLRNKQRDARREQKRDLTPAVLYAQAS